MKADYGLFFWMENCGGCEKMKPVMEKLYDAGYDIRFIDFTARRRFSVQHKVTAVPTLILKTKAGTEIKRWVGRVRPNEVKKLLKKNAEV